MDRLTPALRAALTRHVGVVQRVQHLRSATQATVVRVVGADTTVIYKRPHSMAALQRERRAYHTLVPHLGASMPTLIAEIEGGLVLTELGGTALDSTELDADGLREAYRCVGALRARLDRAPIGDADTLPLDVALGRRFDTWCTKAEAAVDADTLRRARERFDAAAFVGQPRTWCHRDLAPRNLLVDRGGTRVSVGVIDFGHARPDTNLVDLLKLWELPSDRPDLLAAFEAGWGRTLDVGDHERLGMLVLMHGLATTAWAHAHGNPRLEAHGRRIITRALSG